MMRHLTDEERELTNMLHNDKTLSEEEKEAIRHRLKEIDDKKCGDMPFCH